MSFKLVSLREANGYIHVYVHAYLVETVNKLLSVCPFYYCFLETYDLTKQDVETNILCYLKQVTAENGQSSCATNFFSNFYIE